MSDSLAWLRDGQVVVGSGALVELIDRAVTRGRNAQAVLRYLDEVEITPSPALRDGLLRSLPRIKDSANIAKALVVLARWGVSRDAAVQGALDRLPDGAGLRPKTPHVSLFIEALGAWRIPIDVGSLRLLMQERPGGPGSLDESVLDYLQLVRRDEYRTLTPQVVALLRDRNDRLVIAALKTLDLCDYRLTRKEVASLSERAGEVRAATLDYLKRHLEK